MQKKLWKITEPHFVIIIFRENFDSDKLNSLQEDSFKERKNSDFFKYGNKEAYFKDWKSEDFLKDRNVEDFSKEKNNNDQLCHSPHSYCTQRKVRKC